jgi:hypothetical protein
MKIFDYKFIILLGLTLVVYFIYKEVEHLHNSINKLEKDINLLSLQQLRQQPLYQSQQQKPPSPPPPQQQKLLSPSPPQQQKLLSPSPPQQSSQQTLSPSQQSLSPSQQSLSPQKIINIDLLPSKLFKDQIIACNKQSFPNMLNNENENDNDNNIDTDSSIHLAIYSNDNDNEQYNEEHNSLLDNESCDHKFNYNEESIILNNNTSNNNPISMMYDATTLNNSESSELSKSSETHELPELSVLLNDLPNDLLNKSSESSESSGLNDLTNELLNKLPKSSESFELNDLSNLQKTSEIKQNYTKKSLESLKVPEIKIIAENNNVCLTKQINGNIKNKTKHELIEDIINAQK